MKPSVGKSILLFIFWALVRAQPVYAKDWLSRICPLPLLWEKHDQIRHLQNPLESLHSGDELNNDRFMHPLYVTPMTNARVQKTHKETLPLGSHYSEDDWVRAAVSICPEFADAYQPTFERVVKKTDAGFTFMETRIKTDDHYKRGRIVLPNREMLIYANRQTGTGMIGVLMRLDGDEFKYIPVNLDSDPVHPQLDQPLLP